MTAWCKYYNKTVYRTLQSTPLVPLSILHMAVLIGRERKAQSKYLTNYKYYQLITRNALRDNILQAKTEDTRSVKGKDGHTGKISTQHILANCGHKAQRHQVFPQNPTASRKHRVGHSPECVSSSPQARLSWKSEQLTTKMYCQITRKHSQTENL